MAKVDKNPICPNCRIELSKFHKVIKKENDEVVEIRGIFHFCINKDCKNNSLETIKKTYENHFDDTLSGFIQVKK